MYIPGRRLPQCWLDSPVPLHIDGIHSHIFLCCPCFPLVSASIHKSTPLSFFVCSGRQPISIAQYDRFVFYRTTTTPISGDQYFHFTPAFTILVCIRVPCFPGGNFLPYFEI